MLLFTSYDKRVLRFVFFTFSFFSFCVCIYERHRKFKIIKKKEEDFKGVVLSFFLLLFSFALKFQGKENCVYILLLSAIVLSVDIVFIQISISIEFKYRVCCHWFIYLRIGFRYVFGNAFSHLNSFSFAFEFIQIAFVM